MLSKKLFLVIFLLLFALVSLGVVLAADLNDSLPIAPPSPYTAKSGETITPYLFPDRWGITPDSVVFDGDWDAHVESSLGVGWRIADWLELELLFAEIGNSGIDEMNNKLSFTRYGYLPSGQTPVGHYGSNIGNYVDGEQFQTAGYAYFATRWANNSAISGTGYSSFDNFGVDDYYTLGRWYGSRVIYAIILDGAKRNSPQFWDCIPLTAGSNVTLNLSVWDAQNETVNVSIFDGDNNSLYNETGLDSGSEVTFVWSGLEKGTTYEWWASVTDGTNTTNNTMWNFTTCDSCSYSGAGDWNINLADDCLINTSEIVDGDLNILGDAGSVVFNVSVSAEGFSFKPNDFDGDGIVSFISGAVLGFLT